MLRKLGIPTLAVAAALAMTAPATTFARDRDDHRGRSFERHEQYRGYEGRGYEGREYREREHEFRDRGRFNFGVGIYTAPAPVASGFYDEYGVWHPSGFYDRYGVWHPYSY